ncbi:MAG TPA: hypothetical protein VIA18_09835 [Polyangia bacterium]|nr:hypothetical protein [Polyangia bacterium]
MRHVVASSAGRVDPPLFSRVVVVVVGALCARADSEVDATSETIAMRSSRAD